MALSAQNALGKGPKTAIAALLRLRNALDQLAQPSQPASFSSLSGTEPSAAINWVFLGPPGVGKGTYASRVAKAFGVPHIATGDLIRAEIAAGSELGAQVRHWFAPGACMPPPAASRTIAYRCAPTSSLRAIVRSVAVSSIERLVMGMGAAFANPQMKMIVNQGQLLPDQLVQEVRNLWFAHWVLQ